MATPGCRIAIDPRNHRRLGGIHATLSCARKPKRHRHRLAEWECCRYYLLYVYTSESRTSTEQQWWTASGGRRDGCGHTEWRWVHAGHGYSRQWCRGSSDLSVFDVDHRPYNRP